VDVRISYYNKSPPLFIYAKPIIIVYYAKAAAEIKYIQYITIHNAKKYDKIR